MFSLTICFGPSAAMWVLMFKTEEGARAAEQALYPKPLVFSEDAASPDELKEAKAYPAVMTQSEMSKLRGSVNVTDDFGQSAHIDLEQLHGVMLEDMEQSKLAHIERALHQGRTQAKAQEMAADDAVLKAARFRQGSTPVLTPMGGNFSGGR